MEEGAGQLLGERGEGLAEPTVPLKYYIQDLVMMTLIMDAVQYHLETIIITCPSLKHINVLVWGRTKLLYRPRCAIFGVFTVPCCGGHDWTRAFGRSPATAGRGK